MDISALPTWEWLQKRMTWEQLFGLKGKRLLDFGSGNGATAAWFSRENEVVAVEPDTAVLKDRFPGDYTQLTGSLDALAGLEPESFDAVLCHNVLEYVEDQGRVVRALEGLLKPGGVLSVLKHNRPGRVMQMAVLLNDFGKANALLDGGDSHAEAYGAIRYYEDGDISHWAPRLRLKKTLGQRTFWDLQQNQDIQTDPVWREEMLALEHRVSSLPEYQNIAFFHHLFFEKSENLS